MLQKTKAFLEENGKKIGLAVAAAVTVGVGAYLLVNARDSDDKNADGRTQASDNSSFVGPFVKSEKYMQTVQALREVIASSGGRIPNQKVLMILIQVTVELYRTRFSALYLQNRTERRQVISKPALYSQKVEEGNALGEQLFDEATQEVLKDTGVDQAHYDEELEKATMSDPNFSRAVTYLYSSVKVQVNKSGAPKPTPEDIVAFFQAQIDEINKGSLAMFDGLEVTQAMMCKQTYLGDIASIKLGIEEEAIAQDHHMLSLSAVRLKHLELGEKIKEALGVNEPVN